jgi:hypothetical protein
MRILAAFFRFWYAFIIGDDWKIAAAVVSVLLAGALALLTTGDFDLLPPLLAVGIGAAFTVAVLIDTPPRRG